MTPRPPACACARALLDAVHQIGPAGADVGAEHVRAVALVVHAAGDRRGGIGELGDVAEHVDRDAADRRQEHVQVGPRHELGEHAGRLLEQSAAQARLGGVEALGDARQMPDRIDGDLDHGQAAVGLHDRVIGGRAGPRRSPARSRAGRGGRASPRCWGGCRCRRRSLGRKASVDHVPPGVERYDLGGTAPLREGTDGDRGVRVGEIGALDRTERPGRNGERAIEGIASRRACR